MLGYGGHGPFGFVRVRLIRFGQVWSGGLGAAGHVTSLCGPLRFGWARQGGRVRVWHWVGESGCGFIRRSN